MAQHKQRTQNFIKNICKNAFLDAELVRLLVEIDDCSHFGVIDSTINMQLKNSDMSAWAGTFYDYSILCKKLENYNENKLKKYTPRT